MSNRNVTAVIVSQSVSQHHKILSLVKIFTMALPASWRIFLSTSSSGYPFDTAFGYSQRILLMTLCSPFYFGLFQKIDYFLRIFRMDQLLAIL